jgi:hypothetical protein
MTQTAEISALARHLYDERGPKAISEAAQKAAACEAAGDAAQARTWRRVQAVLEEMRGPRET